MKILLEISYNGSAYHGWQSQGKSGVMTVQGVLSDVFEKLFAGECSVTGVSRTDAGVHALRYFCTLEAKNANIPCASLPYAANSLLPDDISVISASECPDDFHARYSCVAKEYIYLVYDTPQRDPFLSRRAWHRFYRLNVEEMDRAAKQFVGTHDFTSFCCAQSDQEDKTRTVYSCGVSRKSNGIVEISIKGNGFLYNMVRIIAGTLVGVSEGKFKPGEIPAILESRNRACAGMTAPAFGLYLKDVFY